MESAKEYGYFNSMRCDAMRCDETMRSLLDEKITEFYFFQLSKAVCLTKITQFGLFQLSKAVCLTKKLLNLACSNSKAVCLTKTLLNLAFFNSPKRCGAMRCDAKRSYINQLAGGMILRII